MLLRIVPLLLLLSGCATYSWPVFEGEVVTSTGSRLVAEAPRRTLRLIEDRPAGRRLHAFDLSTPDRRACVILLAPCRPVADGPVEAWLMDGMSYADYVYPGGELRYGYWRRVADLAPADRAGLSEATLMDGVVRMSGPQQRDDYRIEVDLAAADGTPPAVRGTFRSAKGARAVPEVALIPLTPLLLLDDSFP